MKTTTIDRPFGRMLAELRDRDQGRQGLELERRCAASLARADELLAAFQRVEEAGQLIERRLMDLGREIAPGIVAERRLYDGRWQVGARLDEIWVEPDGEPRRDFSQIVFLLQPLAA